MSETTTVPPLVNKTMKFILRSPVHGMVSKTVLLITFTGRKSGKTCTTPVSYSRDDDLVYIFTHASWWKNLVSNTLVTLRIQGREFQGLAEPVAEDKQAIAAGLMAHLRKTPSDARWYGVTFDDHGNPRAEEVDQAVQTVVMIRVRLCNARGKSRALPVAGTNLARILSDAEYRQAFHGQLKQYNPLVVILYKIGLLPLFGVSRTVMLLNTRGRKSGKLRSTPIGYFRIGGVVHLFSAWGKATGWYKNMTACPGDVRIQIGMHQRAVEWRELKDPGEIAQTIAQFVTESPAQARYLFGWDPDLDRLDQADFSNVIDRVLIVRFIEKDENRL